MHFWYYKFKRSFYSINKIKSVINNYINNSVHVCIPSQNNVDVFAKYIAFKPMCLEIAVLLYSLAVYVYVFYIAITDTSFATSTY